MSLLVLRELNLVNGIERSSDSVFDICDGWLNAAGNDDADNSIAYARGLTWARR